MIRQATLNDADAIYALAVQAKEQSIRKEYDPSRVRRTIDFCLNAPHCHIEVLEVDGAVRGLVAGLIAPAIDLNGDVATDLMFYVEPEFRGYGKALLDSLVKWAFEFDSVQYVELRISFGGEEASRTERWYQRLGFERTGASFIVRRMK